MDKKVDRFLRLVQHNNIDGVKEFLVMNNHNGVSDVNSLVHQKSGDSALHLAAQLGHLDLLRYLIEEQHGNPEIANLDGKTPLHDAAQFTQPHVLEHLIAIGANVNAVKKADWSPLMLACTKQDVRVIGSLLRAGADPAFRNKDGWNSLHIAVREGSVPIVTLLLGVPGTKTELCSSRSKNGRTPLHTAVMHGHAEVTRMLLTQADGILDSNDPDHCGNTPLMDAARFGFPEILNNLLADFRGDLTIRNRLGMNCLHIAAESGQVGVIEILLDKYGMGGNEAALPSGLTPLHWAVKENQLGAVQCLLKHGASLILTDSKGRTCIDMARSLKKELVYQYLDSL